MKELKEAVSKLVGEELERSMIKFPLFNSPHEGYGVLKEEIEETADELAYVNKHLNIAWDKIKENKDAKNTIFYLKQYAINLAAESIQVAAMCQKYLNSFKED